ncbi:hypothetical protein K443DRAFT_520561 [Laccaria amethystina LaAM-08-1]|uniref:Calpain catalytic domain-containing protein n=1 Tax=Laccaria amethystina LaAM-08-1 TaxID=1095629 RepID=A0A0C9WTL3_9AGAR|nr:hypothetical protein K443DRAFT_520561 [Laccaria amethystina LaAM-08-1]
MLDVKRQQRVGTKSRSGRSIPTPMQSWRHLIPAWWYPPMSTKKKPSPATRVIRFVYPNKQPGLLVTDELEAAIKACRGKVERISRDVEPKLDIEFDLEKEFDQCFYGISTVGKANSHADVLRVTQIFENPYFFSPEGAANSNDIMQGKLGDCWFLSVQAIASTTQGLIEKF